MVRTGFIFRNNLGNDVTSTVRVVGDSLNYRNIVELDKIKIPAGSTIQIRGVTTNQNVGEVRSSGDPTTVNITSPVILILSKDGTNTVITIGEFVNRVTIQAIRATHVSQNTITAAYQNRTCLLYTSDAADE